MGLEKKTLKKLYQIKSKAENLKTKTEEDLVFFREKLLKSEPSLIQLDWFALVQEISARKLGLRHFDPQLLAGLFLSEGKVIEMKTGEGKTLASTLAISYKALEKKGVHAITVNEYLAERDENSMGKLYKALGLTSALIKNSDSLLKKQKSYQADISYLTNSEVVFDYLRDCTAYDSSELVQRPFFFCVIDEIDSILIDEARTPLILSTSSGDTREDNFSAISLTSSSFSNISNPTKKIFIANSLAKFLEKDRDFILDEKTKDISLSQEGYKKSQNYLQVSNLYDPSNPWMLYILNALKANYSFKKNKDYMIKNQKIVIIDEFTGRIMEDRRWNKGLHEAIEAKEKLSVGEETKSKISITYQNFFPLYPSFSGMTGTAKLIEKELKTIYNRKVIVLPTVKPLIRKDLQDLIFVSQTAKWKAVLTQSKKCFETGQPILIGTTSIEKSEFLSDLFKLANIPHKLLNAKPENVKSENQIIAQAGELYAVTIATNMAGRGTDILLGGNLEFRTKQQISQTLTKLIEFPKLTSKSKSLETSDISEINKNKEIEFIQNIEKDYKNQKENLIKQIDNLPYSLEETKPSLYKFYNYLFTKNFETWKKQNQKVKELGGLFVLGTERHENRRIDDQLRGRSGRQGDPGSSQFFISLEDELLQNFGGKTLQQWVKNFLEEEDAPLESSALTRSIKSTQEKVENYNYEIRKNVFDYDENTNFQRLIFFNSRKSLLENPNYFQLFLRYKENSKNFLDFLSIWRKTDLETSFLKTYGLEIFPQEILNSLDNLWTQHSENLEFMRDTINWRAYGMQNPLIEYNIRSFELFQKIFSTIELFSLNYLESKVTIPNFFDFRKKKDNKNNTKK